MEVQATRLYFDTIACKKPVIVHVGGARSSKSYSIAQVMVTKMRNGRGRKMLVTRKTFPALKMTAYENVLEVMRTMGCYRPQNHNQTFHTYTMNGNTMFFRAMDDALKFRSTEFTDIWLEEANEFTWDDFMTLRVRMSGQAKDPSPNQMFMSLNPSDAYSWINLKLIHEKYVKTIQSSYKDNPFLARDYISILENLKDEDETYYKIYTLGVWATPKSIIYSNYDIMPFEKFPQSFDDVFYGMDFGYNNPSVLLFVGIKDKDVYLRELIYQSQLTNQDLVQRVKESISEEYRRKIIYADESEPDRIEEFKRAGLKCEPTIKGKNSVKDGIDYVKRLKLHISEDSVNFIKEIRGYKWREDKNGHVLDEPVKFMDHVCDAARYALFSHGKVEPLVPSVVLVRARHHQSFVVGHPDRSVY